MKLQRNGKTWKIERRASIFVSRNGCEDTRVYVEADHGAKDREDNKRYTTVLVVASESGAMLRHYEPVPQEITLDFLQDNGFVDKMPEHG